MTLPVVLLGCDNGTSIRTTFDGMSNAAQFHFSNITVQACQETCRNSSFAVSAATTQICFCGVSIDAGKLQKTGCTSSDRISVFNYTGALGPTQASSVTADAAAPAKSSAPVAGIVLSLFGAIALVFGATMLMLRARRMQSQQLPLPSPGSKTPPTPPSTMLSLPRPIKVPSLTRTIKGRFLNTSRVTPVPAAPALRSQPATPPSPGRKNVRFNDDIDMISRSSIFTESTVAPPKPAASPPSATRFTVGTSIPLDVLLSTPSTPLELGSINTSGSARDSMASTVVSDTRPRSSSAPPAVTLARKPGYVPSALSQQLTMSPSADGDRTTNKPPSITTAPQRQDSRISVLSPVAAAGLRYSLISDVVAYVDAPLPYEKNNGVGQQTPQRPSRARQGSAPPSPLKSLASFTPIADSLPASLPPPVPFATSPVAPPRSLPPRQASLASNVRDSTVPPSSATAPQRDSINDFNYVSHLSMSMFSGDTRSSSSALGGDRETWNLHESPKTIELLRRLEELRRPDSTMVPSSLGVHASLPRDESTIGSPSDDDRRYWQAGSPASNRSFQDLMRNIRDHS
ncbi:hypothetical protein RI367_005314 [Sorochytrium milnesiophthora]